MLDLAFLSFSLGPVQSFIAGARTVRDLWTGSYLLSWLTFRAMTPVLEAHGPKAFVSPALADHPLRHWYALSVEERRRGAAPDDALSPCLPNRFLAEVPSATAEELAERCRKRCVEEWGRICEQVYLQLQEEIRKCMPSWIATWDRDRWERQVTSCFDITTAVLPWETCRRPQMARLLAGYELPNGDDDSALWPARWQVLAGLMQARRMVRHVPLTREEGPVPMKCSLLGTYEQMGPSGLDDSRAFWDAFADGSIGISLQGTRTRKRERLCAVSLAKRFAWPAFFLEELGRKIHDLRYEDTATVAARAWLAAGHAFPLDEVRKKVGEWSGQWLHWSRPDQEKTEGERTVPDWVWELIRRKKSAQERVPTYYAILMMDADGMGDRLAHANRLRQATISAALARFALREVRSLVENHFGELIYAGGDDVLALFPTSTALSAAHALNVAFQRIWQEAFPREPVATVSAGLVVAHYKEDLRFVVNQAREAEKEAKSGGRNALQIRVCRRSGEHSSARCPWSYLGTVQSWVDAFLQKASDRWAYHLKSDQEVLRGQALATIQAEIRRQVGRAEDATRRLFGSGSASAGEILATAFKIYVEEVLKKTGEERITDKISPKNAELVPSAVDERGHLKAPTSLDQFLTLCQSASFLARGRDL